MDVKVTRGLLMTALITGSVMWGGYSGICRRELE